MAKFVIEIDTANPFQASEYGYEFAYKAVGFDSLYFDRKGMEKLKRLEDVIEEAPDSSPHIEPGDYVRHTETNETGIVLCKDDSAHFCVCLRANGWCRTWHECSLAVIDKKPVKTMTDLNLWLNKFQEVGTKNE